MQSKDGITMYIPKTLMSTNATEEESDVAFLEHYERLKFLGRGVYDCMESFESYLGNLYPAEHTRVDFLTKLYRAVKHERVFLGERDRDVLERCFYRRPDGRSEMRGIPSESSRSVGEFMVWRVAPPLETAASDSWLVEGLAGNLANAYVQKCCGMNEMSYRRAKEAEEVAMNDDGKMLPPLCSQAVTRLWREGCTTGGKDNDTQTRKKWTTERRMRKQQSPRMPPDKPPKASNRKKFC